MNNSLPFLIGLGLGLGLAAGMRPYLPALISGALASGGLLGLSYSPGTFSFLQSTWWLVASAAALLAVYLLQLRLGSQRMDSGPIAAALSGIGVGVGAVLFAGTLSGHGELSWPGLLGGAVAALLAQAAVWPLIRRARARLPEESTRNALTLYVDVGAVLLTILTALLHPLGYLAVLLLAWLALAGRRRAGGRYAGLRILGR